MFLSRNLLYFRQKNGLTRQQVSAELRIRPDILSGWESGRTQPEAKFLAVMARLYGVTIDDLFARRPGNFENYAQRLASVFDATHDPEDFAFADMAFRQLRTQSGLTGEDLRQYAALQQTMMDLCMEKALSLYSQLQAMTSDNEPVVRKARQQYMHMLIKLGRPSTELDAYLTELAATSTDPEEWLALVSAFQDAQRNDEALQWLHLAQERFPGEPMLCYWGGTIFQSQGRWEDALTCWEQALRLDPEFTDAVYACAECREHMGDMQNACDLWNSLVRRLESRGFTAEAAYPREQARRCRAQLG